MKKLMFAAAALAAGAAMAIESQVVGYSSVGKNGTYVFTCYGSSFVKPGQTSYSLADMSVPSAPTGQVQARNSNNIQFFATGTTPKLDATRKYYYCGGKWYFMGAGSTASNDHVIEDPSTITIPACVGFLTKLTGALKLVYSGEVIAGVDKSVSIGKQGTYTYFVAANPCPYEITLNDISVTGAPTGQVQARNSNNIQFFATGTTPKLDATRKYYYCGDKWYFMGAGSTASNDHVIEDPTSIKILANEGFLTKLTGTIKINLPTAL